MAYGTAAEVLLQGVEEWNEWRKKFPRRYVSLCRVDLSGRTLDRIDLQGVDLRGANLSQTSLRKAQLANAIVQDADLTDTDLSGADLTDCLHDRSVLWRCILTDATRISRKWRMVSEIVNGRRDLLVDPKIDLKGSNLHGADLSGQDLSEVDFWHARIANTQISNSTVFAEKWKRVWLLCNKGGGVSLEKGMSLSGADLCGVNFSSFDFGGCDLSYALLRGCDLSQANLNGVDLTDVDLFLANLLGTQLDGATISEKWRRVWRVVNGERPSTDCAGADFSSANLQRARFYGDLADVDFRGADLRGVSIERSCLRGVKVDGLTELDPWLAAIVSLYDKSPSPDLRSALRERSLHLWDFNGLSFRSMDLSGTDFTLCKLIECNFEESLLSGAVFRNTILRGAKFRGANVSGANLIGAELNHADLRELQISDATQIDVKWREVIRIHKVGAQALLDFQERDLTEADLDGAKLVDADLERYNFSGATLVGANLSLSRISNAIFVNAKLDRADLKEAVLAEANFKGASLTGADMSKAELQRVCWDGSSIDTQTSISDKWRLVWGLVNGETPHLPENELDLEDADLRGADLSHLRAERVNLRGALIDVDASISDKLLAVWIAHNSGRLPIRSQLERFQHRSSSGKNAVRFANMDMSKTDLNGLDLKGADLVNTDLTEARLAGTDLEGANLHRAMLKSADMKEARLRRSNLKYANLEGADLRGADLAHAALEDANLTNAKLHNANVRGMSLKGVRFSRRHSVMDDGADQIRMGIRDRLLNWALLRFIGRFPLFGISWTAFTAALGAVRIVEWLNKSAFSMLASPFLVSSRTLLFIVASLFLVIGSTIYRFFCPLRVQEFSEVQWVDIHGHPRLQYIADKIAHRFAQWPVAIFTGMGGLVALLLLADSVLLAFGSLLNVDTMNLADLVVALMRNVVTTVWHYCEGNSHL